MYSFFFRLPKFLCRLCGPTFKYFKTLKNFSKFQIWKIWIDFGNSIQHIKRHKFSSSLIEKTSTISHLNVNTTLWICILQKLLYWVLHVCSPHTELLKIIFLLLELALLILILLERYFKNFYFKFPVKLKRKIKKHVTSKNICFWSVTRCIFYQSEPFGTLTIVFFSCLSSCSSMLNLISTQLDSICRLLFMFQ